MEAAMKKSRKEHKACRESEQQKNATAKAKCDKLDTALSDITQQLKLDAGGSRDDLVADVQRASAYACSIGASFANVSKECRAAQKESDDVTRDCSTKQVTFENNFCTWRTEKTDTCSSFTDCFDTALSEYYTHVDETRPLVEKWK